MRPKARKVTGSCKAAFAAGAPTRRLLLAAVLRSVGPKLIQSLQKFPEACGVPYARSCRRRSFAGSRQAEGGEAFAAQAHEFYSRTETDSRQEKKLMVSCCCCSNAAAAYFGGVFRSVGPKPPSPGPFPRCPLRSTVCSRLPSTFARWKPAKAESSEAFFARASFFSCTKADPCPQKIELSTICSTV